MRVPLAQGCRGVRRAGHSPDGDGLPCNWQFDVVSVTERNLHLEGEIVSQQTTSHGRPFVVVDAPHMDNLYTNAQGMPVK